MLGAGDQTRSVIGACTLAGEDVHLLVGAVGVVLALQRQDRDRDVGEQAGDVEVAESRVQPGVVPAMERDVDVAVIAGEALAQVAGFVLGLDLADAGDVQVFDEEMRGDGDDAQRGPARWM